MFSLLVSPLLSLDSQARCSAGGSGGHFWSDGCELREGVSAEAKKEGAAKGLSHATRRRRALVLVAVGASQGWSASLLSLPALAHHLR